jgi:hypothetical protein
MKYKIKQLYETTALVFFNSLIYFLIINISIFVGYSVKGIWENKKSNPVIEKYGTTNLLKAYPHLDKSEMQQLLYETWSRRYMYEPFTQFKERPFSGKFVNVSPHGYRHSINQGEWPPEPTDISIFLFGGSSTFGYGVSDSHTIASYLVTALSEKEKGLNFKIFNFGRGFYYSSQERALFEKLLVSGFTPDLAIFFDGLNEFYYLNTSPHFSEKLQQMFDHETRWPNMDNISFLDDPWLKKIPLLKLAHDIKQMKIKSEKQSQNGKILISKEKLKRSAEDNTKRIDRYLSNKKIIEAVSSVHHVETLFVWQPIPTYKYDITSHLFVGDDILLHMNAQKGYHQISKKLNSAGLAKNFLWCADIQQNIHEPLYVDSIHYTAKMSELIANKIAEFVIQNRLLHK